MTCVKCKKPIAPGPRGLISITDARPRDWCAACAAQSLVNFGRHASGCPWCGGKVTQLGMSDAAGRAFHLIAVAGTESPRNCVADALGSIEKP